ncbi:MAG: hypothetical protein QXD32_07745, partial [Nitrososphaerota archaeon]
MTQSFKIERAEARIVFDSRGSQTVEVELGSGSVSYSVAAPAGKSRGGREVQAYPSNGVAEAVKAFREMVRPRLLGADPADQRAIDGMLAEIDGTGGFSRIGGNTAYSVSICSAGLASRLAGKPLWEHVAKLSGLRPSIPIPLGNVLGGGAHAGRGAPDIQEILVFHTAAETPFEAVAENIAVHRRVGEKLSEMLPDYGGGKGDEGAYAPPLDDETALKAVKESAGGLVAVGLDVAANSIYISGRKVYR